jgi:hypothetical protein
MFSWLKVALIKAADAINKISDPWDNFTRLAYPTPGTLAEKAAAFEADLVARFFDPSTSFFQYMIPFNTGDQSLWHGIASTMWAIRNTLYSDGKMVSASIAGLAKHQPNGFLMRGQVGSLQEWQTSNDQGSGHFCGLYFTGQKDLCKQWAAQIINHDYAMTEPDGTITKYGKLEDGILTDPLRLTLLLGILKYAEADTRYNDLLRRYGSLVKYPKISLVTLGKTYDTHRAAIHLSILNDLDPGCSYYKEGLMRMLPDANKEGNAWVMLLCARAGLPANPFIIKKVLSEFGVTERLRGNVERLNSRDAALWESRNVKFKKWGGELCATQPLPRNVCGSQDFYWQRNLRSVDNWAGNTGAPDTFHSGLDYLLCYYLARSLGIIMVDE